MPPASYVANADKLAAPAPSRRATRELDRPALRTRLEALAARAELLGDVDRLMIRQRLAGMSLRELSRLRGVSVWRIRRRLARIRARLTDPCFLLASHYGAALPSQARAVGQSYFVEGLTLRACACRHRMTLHRVRQAMTAVRQMLVLAGRMGTVTREASVESEES